MQNAANDAEVTQTATTPVRCVWAQFSNGNIVLVDNADGRFVTMVNADSDGDELSEALSEAITGSVDGIEAYSFVSLPNNRYIVSGYICGWSEGPEEDSDLQWAILDPKRPNFASAAAVSLGLTIIQVEHALASFGNEYGPESVITTTEGLEIRCAAYPLEVDSVRITVPSVVPLEIAYWSADEWADAPAEVMGAILGAARGKPAI